MATKTIKQIYDLCTAANLTLLFEDDIPYPDIEGNTSNFVDDYIDNSSVMDPYIVRQYGTRSVDFESSEDLDIINEWKFMVQGIYSVYIYSWALLYYTLNIPYNPIYNVEEHTTTTYGQHETTNATGQRQDTNAYGVDATTHNYGAKSTTNGQRTDTNTDYSVSFDAGTEKETGKNENVEGSQTISSLAYVDSDSRAAHTDTLTKGAATDTLTSKQHIDTIDREGNIGTVAAIDLIEKEEKFRRNYSFFRNIFLTIMEEVGSYYECDTLL